MTVLDSIRNTGGLPMDLFLSILQVSIIELLYFSGILIVVGSILGFLERKSSEYMQRAFGWKGVLATAWIGTPIHELGHAIMCIIFGHRITKIKFLDLHSKNGVLGYVENSYNKSNIYQRIGNLFIGIGPFFSGIAALLISLNFLLPYSLDVFEKSLKSGMRSDTLNLFLISWCFGASINLIKSIFIFSNLTRISFWIFLILAFSISAHMALSKPDIKGALNGYIVIFVLIFIINLAAKIFTINTYSYIVKIGRINVYFSALLIMALVFSIISFIISFVLYTIKKLI